MRLKNVIRRAAWATAPQSMMVSEELQALRNEVLELRSEIERLTKEVDEARRDSLRIAELTDLVVTRLSE
ncbi:hypothetical protein SAMN04489806_0196 [Paramicrobacterium humi]|uniref:DUF6752 domain-containing protein n=1 Tax=Paramicrobacterium humi TaxID=640635 RepID=A0A1H4IRM6_9MICO|nr:DUF6752 domain-containing protein [Microbacterium humi]SEB36709.1 hypothetical protein SAMN04489806_0196 [Microbacterium humi]